MTRSSSTTAVGSTGQAFVISTGSRPAVPPIEGLEAAGYLTNETIWTLNARPESLAVIGAGSVGVELAQAMSRLGVEVTLIEASPRVLPAEDPEVGERLRKALEAEGIKVFTGADDHEGRGPRRQEGRPLPGRRAASRSRPPARPCSSPPAGGRTSRG